MVKIFLDKSPYLIHGGINPIEFSHYPKVAKSGYTDYLC